MQSRLFQTGSMALPASRFICEHLHQNLDYKATMPMAEKPCPEAT
jgi:hypothetical protein